MEAWGWTTHFFGFLPPEAQLGSHSKFQKNTLLLPAGEEEEPFELHHRTPFF